MNVTVHATPDDLGRAAARHGADALRRALAEKSEATCFLATGTSQLATLGHLLAEDLPWQRVQLWHLDEYIGIAPDHPASFVGYLWTRFVRRLPVPPRAFVSIDALSDADAEVTRLNRLAEVADVTFLGIGENGHLAFNDPPADLTTTAPFAIVTLDDACRRQQLGEGWFPTLDAVPRRTISMTVPFLLRSGVIIASVPDARKADAVTRAVTGPTTADCPASALQTHPDCTLFLDAESAAELD